MSLKYYGLLTEYQRDSLSISKGLMDYMRYELRLAVTFTEFSVVLILAGL
jgi:hypothetical protein